MWSGDGAGKLSVPGHNTNLDNSQACSRCRWGCLGIFSLVCPISGRQPKIDLYFLKGQLNPKQSAN